MESTNHRLIYHQPPDHRSLTNQSTDTIIIVKRLGNRKIFILQNTNIAGKIILVYYLFDEQYLFL